ncbi:hypothetical protein Tco_0576388, partial [Tanacetum coccineum]
MESSATREYPSLIHTFFLTHTVNGVFLNPEDKALYDEMLRLQGLGSNTETGVPYTEDRARSDDKFSQMLTQPEIGGGNGSGGPGDDEQGHDEDDGEDEEDEDDKLVILVNIDLYLAENASFVTSDFIKQLSRATCRPGKPSTVALNSLPETTWARRCRPGKSLRNNHSTSIGTSSDTATGALSYRPRKRTRGSVLIRNKGDASGSSSPNRQHVCVYRHNQTISVPGNHPISVGSSSGTLTNASATHTGPPLEYKHIRKCEHCGARFWYEERIKDNLRSVHPLYHRCCKAGRVVIRTYQIYPEYVKLLLRDRHYLENIRAYNQMFSMTSLGAKVDDSVNIGRGPYVFKISSQLYHWLGSLCPAEGAVGLCDISKVSNRRTNVTTKSKSEQHKYGDKQEQIRPVHSTKSHKYGDEREQAGA